MSFEDQGNDMINDLQAGMRLLRKKLETIKTSLGEIAHQSRADRVIKSEIDKIIILENINKLANQTLEQLKET